MQRAALALAAMATVAAVATGCGGFGGGMSGPTAHLTNGTAVPAVVSVNGGWVGTYPSGASVDVPLGGHGGPPYRIEVRTPTGGLLSEFDITADDVAALARGQGFGAASGSECGSIELLFGPAGGEAPPAPAPLPDPAACP